MSKIATRREYLGGITALGASGALTGCLRGLGHSEESIPVGAILPVSASGTIGDIGAQHTTAVEQAVADVNRAGGIDGRELDLDVRDSTGSVGRALEEYRGLVDAGTVGFVGAVLSSVSIELAAQVADDGIVQLSPASTSPRLAEMGARDDLKFFGRTVPNDLLQAYVMAKILNDGRYIDAETAAILHVNDAFGTGLAAEIGSAFDGEVTSIVGFDPDADDYTETIEVAVGTDPDGIALVGVPGAATQGVLEQRREVDHAGEWVLSAGLLPGDPATYHEGLYGGSLASARTTAAAKLDQKLGQFDELAPFTQQAYDAMFLQALALQRAEERTSEGIARNLRAVSGGDGHTVTVGEFERAKKLLANGREVNYRGASGNVDLLDTLEPLSEYLVQYVSEGAVEDVELLKTGFFREVLEG
jgi:ABC-type branched-subunit amino acid transport system substrate-binding protein